MYNLLIISKYTGQSIATIQSDYIPRIAEDLWVDHLCNGINTTIVNIHHPINSSLSMYERVVTIILDGTPEKTT